MRSCSSTTGFTADLCRRRPTSAARTHFRLRGDLCSRCNSSSQPCRRGDPAPRLPSSPRPALRCRRSHTRRSKATLSKATPSSPATRARTPPPPTRSNPDTRSSSKRRQDKATRFNPPPWFGPAARSSKHVSQQDRPISTDAGRAGTRRHGVRVGGDEGEHPKAPEVPKMEAKGAEPNIIIEDKDSPYIATLVPESTIDFEPQVNGRIEKMLVTTGQAVKKGDPIAMLDKTEAEESLKLARGRLAAARGAAGQAAARQRGLARKLESEKALADQGIVARQGVDDLRASRSEAAGGSAAAGGAVIEAERRSSSTNASSRTPPSAPRLGARFPPVPQGRSANRARSSAGPHPGHLQDGGDVCRTSRGIQSFAVGQSVSVEVDWHDKPLVATIQTIAPAVDPPSGLVYIEATLAVGTSDSDQAQQQSLGPPHRLSERPTGRRRGVVGLYLRWVGVGDLR